jgi:hypothetical protein
MDSQKIKAILVVFLSAIAAVYLGIAAATAQTVAILWVVGVLGVVFVLALGKNVWVLIVIGTGLSGGIALLPGAPPLWMLAIPLTLGIFLLRTATRRSNEFTWQWSLMDFAVIMHALLMAQAYLRNPVGFGSLGSESEMIGGRAYIAHMFSILGYILLSMVRVGDLRVIRIIVIAVICASVFDGSAALLGAFIPGVAAVGLKFYTGFSFESATASTGVDAGTTRVTEGKSVGEDLAKAAFSLYRPLSALNPLNFIPFAMISLGTASILISGFRSVMGYVALYFVVASLLRRKVADVVIAAGVGIVAICFFLAIGTENLPVGAQRILGVLPIPGLVSEQVKESGAASTEWRVEMWVLALTTDRYIINKWIGDGFGFRRDETEAAIDAAFGDRRRYLGGRQEMQDVMMRRGSYHGFHVQTIRMTGYIGLLLALITLGIFFRNAWSHIQYFRGRPEWGYVIYICIPFLIFPFYAMLVFGDYNYGYPKYILMAGLLKMLWNVRHAEARDYSYQRSHREIETLSQPTARRERTVRALPAPAMRAR